MWAYNETFYQIYPIGFCGAPTHNDGVTMHRILKIADWAGYLEELGIGSIILNPIFESDNHGYDTRDLTKIDCRLGTNEDFQTVCETLHSHNIKIMLDGVFNHVGRGFWAFQDVLEKKWDSPYKDWFYINFDGNSAYNDGFWYEGWEGHYELVKLNNEGTTIVMVTHDAKVAAKCGRVLFIVDGNIKGEYTGLKEITDEKERERSLNNWLLDLGW
jgi:cyclomaltodextrinase